MDRPIRKPMRLREYDYSSPGAYFITICTRERDCLLSRILVGAVGDAGPYKRCPAVAHILLEANDQPKMRLPPLAAVLF